MQPSGPLAQLNGLRFHALGCSCIQRYLRAVSKAAPAFAKAPAPATMLWS